MAVKPKISGSISARDYLQAQRLHRKSVAKWTNISTVVLCVSGIAALVAGSTNIAALFALCTGFGAFVGENLFTYVHLPRRVKKIHAQRKDLANQFSYSWDDQYLYIESKSITGLAQTPWTHYVKAKEDKHIFLLYRSEDFFEMLPKAWFPDAETIDEFRRLAFRQTKA